MLTVYYAYMKFIFVCKQMFFMQNLLNALRICCMTTASHGCHSLFPAIPTAAHIPSFRLATTAWPFLAIFVLRVQHILCTIHIIYYKCWKTNKGVTVRFTKEVERNSSFSNLSPNLHNELLEVMEPKAPVPGKHIWSRKFYRSLKSFLCVCHHHLLTKEGNHLRWPNTSKSVKELAGIQYCLCTLELIQLFILWCTCHIIYKCENQT